MCVVCRVFNDVRSRVYTLYALGGFIGCGTVRYIVLEKIKGLFSPWHPDDELLFLLTLLAAEEQEGHCMEEGELA